MGERTTQQTSHGDTYRVEYRAFCPAAWSEMTPDEPRAVGEIVLDCTRAGVEEAVGTVRHIKADIRFEQREGQDGYLLDLVAEAVGPANLSPEQQGNLRFLVEASVSVALLPAFGQIWVLWANAVPTGPAPTAQDATGDVA